MPDEPEAVSESDSILDSTKKLLNIDPSYTAFDLDITVHINSAFTTLHQLKVGPVGGFTITDRTSKWNDFVQEDKLLSPVKSYVFLRVRLLFDPPETSYARENFKKQLDEIEWRLNVYVESEKSDD